MTAMGAQPQIRDRQLKAGITHESLESRAEGVGQQPNDRTHAGQGHGHSQTTFKRLGQFDAEGQRQQGDDEEHHGRAAQTYEPIETVVQGLHN